jgi:hypothetical protein
MGIGLGIGINRSNYAQGIFGAYQSRVVADGGITEGGACVDAVSSLLQSASLLLIPSGYKGGKAYAEIPTNGNGDLTWTRASDAWRTNADGLIQRVPWNLLQRSEEFDNVAWSKLVTTVTANAEIAPNATMTADTMTVSTTDSRVEQTTTLGGGTYTFSAYVKIISQTTAGTMRLQGFVDGTGVSASFTPTTEWQRFTATYTPTTSITSLRIRGQGFVGTLAIWGAQLVEGSSAQTYFPTTDRLNVPRLSYMYGSCPALLLEPQRTNFIKQSQAFDDITYWGTGNTTITANDEISPDGTTNAESMTIIDSTSQVLQTLVLGAGTYTASVWVKSLSGTPLIRLRLIADTASIAQNINTTSSWQRATFTFTATTSVTQFGIRGLTGSGEIAIFGAQLEAGAYPTTYIPTTTASATRVADSFSRNNIYTNGLITSSGGTWFVELRGNLSLTPDTTGQGISFGDNVTMTSGNQLQIRSLNTNSRMTIAKRVAGSFTSLYTTTTDTTKIAIKWNGTTADVFVNGTKQVSATAFTATALEYLQTNILDTPKFIQSMALYPSPLSDTDCTTLTTL